MEMGADWRREVRENKKARDRAVIVALPVPGKAIDIVVWDYCYCCVLLVECWVWVTV